jgi:adenylosuccinate synthase
MNAFGFTRAIYPYLETSWLKFFQESKNLEKEEFLIPSILENMIKENKCKIKVLGTTSKWYGITYPEDKERVMNAIKDLVNKKEYNNKLWE